MCAPGAVAVRAGRPRVEVDPARIGPFAARGETCRLMERCDEALADFNRATELDPSYKRPAV